MSVLVLSACGQTAKRADINTAKKTKEKKATMTIADVDLNAKDLEEQWKKEQRYGSKTWDY